MAFFKVRTLQVALGAAVLSLAGLVSAQVEQAKPAPAATMEAAKPAVKKHHHHRKGQRPMHERNSSSRETAAANAEAKKGKLDDGQGPNQYERNAFARCEVFKTEIDRMACAERVKNGAVSGSVKDGGILREVTVEEVIR